jgi:hypothetical protein
MMALTTTSSKRSNTVMVNYNTNQEKSYAHLSLAEREEIAIALEQGQSIRSVAASLGRSPSSVSREIKRNAPPVSHVKYRETEPNKGPKTDPAAATQGNAWPILWSKPMWNAIWFTTAGPRRATYALREVPKDALS